MEINQLKSEFDSSVKDDEQNTMSSAEIIPQEFRDKASAIYYLVAKLHRLKRMFFETTKKQNTLCRNLNNFACNEQITIHRRSGFLLQDEVWPCNQYFNKFSCSQIKNYDSINLIFNFELQNCVEFIKECGNLKLPDLTSLQVDCIPPTCQILADFMSNAVPNNLKILVLNNSVQDDSAIMNFYIHSFERMLNSAKIDVYIRYFDLDKDSFERTIKACANSERVAFRGCVLNFDSNLDFAGPQYQIKYLSFDSTGCNFGNKWKHKPERYKLIIKAISESSLKDSLVFINMYACDFDEEYLNEIFEIYELTNISIIERLDEPYEYWH